jgi:L-ascorbate metabolism protein UlaG (beta-lactamase superfamily)
MTTIARLTDSCLTVTTGSGTTLFDPGFHTWESDDFDKATIGDVQRIVITHEHGDHVSPAFVAWLLDRGEDVRVHANAAVAALLAKHEIEVSTDTPHGMTAEDVMHEVIPTGAQPPNRSWTIDGVLTHPGDSYQPTRSAPVLALPLLVPWGSMTASVEFARRMGPTQVVPIHDFYTSRQGRQWAMGLASAVLGGSGIEVVPLDWGERYSV